MNWTWWTALTGKLAQARSVWRASPVSRHGVRPWLLVFAATIVMLMWASLYIRIADERASLQNAKFAELNNLAALLDQHISRITLDADIVLRQLEVDYRIQGRRFDMTRYVEERGLYLHQYNTISIVDENGVMRHSNNTSFSPFNYSQYENFRYHRAHDKKDLFIDKPRSGLITGKPTIYMSRRFNHSDGSFGGTLNVGLDANEFSNFFKHLNLGSDGFMLITGLDGSVRAAQRTGAETSASQNMLTAETLNRILAEKEGHLLEPGQGSGAPQLISFRTLNDYPLKVMVGLSESYALADSSLREGIYVRWRLIATLLIALSVAVLFISLGRGERTRDAIQRSEANLREAQRIAQVGSWERNLLTNATSWSNELYRILGRTPADGPASRESFAEAIHLEDRERVREAYGRKHQHTLEYRLSLANGQVKHVQESFNVVVDENLRPVRLLGTVQDITSRKLAETKLQEEYAIRQKVEKDLFDARLLLAEAERMEIVGRLATGVAHEVKNPLAIIRLGVDYLSGQRPQNDNVAVVLEDIKISVDRADTVIKELLDFSRPRPLNLIPTHVDRIIENAIKLVRHEATQHNIQIISNSAASAAQILADPDRVTQVFINLLSNAAQAIGRDGHIEIAIRPIRVGEREFASHGREHFAPGDEAIVIDIMDDGPGIADEHLEKLFQPFFTTKPTGAGTGIGLAVSLSIVTMHGAAISLVNRPEGGAMASVIFRRYNEPSQ